MKRTTKQEPERKQVGIHVDVNLWRRFRANALEQGIGAGQLIEELIRQYLDRKDKGK